MTPAALRDRLKDVPRYEWRHPITNASCRFLTESDVLAALSVNEEEATVDSWTLRREGPNGKAVVVLTEEQAQACTQLLDAWAKETETHGRPAYAVCRCGHWHSDHDPETLKCPVPRDRVYEFLEFRYELLGHET